MDSTSSIMVALTDIVQEWQELHRKGKVILHSDGDGIKRIEFNYFIDIK